MRQGLHDTRELTEEICHFISINKNVLDVAELPHCPLQTYHYQIYMSYITDGDSHEKQATHYIIMEGLCYSEYLQNF